jgi:hypothetical protein
MMMLSAYSILVFFLYVVVDDVNMLLPQDFKDADFVYLNPEFHGTHYSRKDIETYFLETHTPENPIHYSLSSIPKDFDAATFVISNRDGLRIADINKSIRDSMLRYGWDLKDLLQSRSSVQDAFMATIDQDVHVHERLGDLEFCLAFNDAAYVLHAGALVEGDDVMIRTAIAGGTHVIATVTAILPRSNRCVVRVSNRDQARFFEDPTRLHLRMHGQRLYDIQRLASINYVRGYRSLVGSVTDPARDRDFNPDLYRLLYPETRCLDDYTAYLDYGKHANDGNPRVAKASQLAVDQSMDTDHVQIMNDKIAWSSNMLSAQARANVWNSNAVCRALHAATWSCNQIQSSCLHARDLGNLDASVVIKGAATILNEDKESDVALTVRGAIKAEDYLVTSDARAKHSVDPLSTDWCLTHTLAMAPVQYALKGRDETQRKRYGFLAQDLARDLGDIVRESAGYLPSALMHVRVDRFGRVHSPELFEKLPELRVGDMLKIVAGNSKECQVTVRVVEPPTITITEAEEGDSVYDSEIFVYGHKVPDMMGVDQLQIIPLLVGSIQALTKRLDKLQRLL